MSIRIRTHRVIHLRGWKPNSDVIRVGLGLEVLMGLGSRGLSGTSINRGVGRPKVSSLWPKHICRVSHALALLQLADLAVRLAMLPPCMCGYLGGVARAALGRAADEPRRATTSHDEPTLSRGTRTTLLHVDELLDIDVIDYADRLRCPDAILHLLHQCVEW